MDDRLAAPDPSRSLIVGLAVVWGLFVFALATVMLFSALSVRALASYVHGTGPDASVAVEISEQLRRFTVGHPTEVPLDSAGVVGMDRAALDHLLDVRTIVRLVGVVAAGLGSLLLAVLAWTWFGDGPLLAMSRALRWAGVGVVGTVAVLGVTVAVGFDRFFVAFHEALFSGGNWMFSADSLLIRTFPEPFWIAAAVGWLGVVVLCAALMLLGSAATGAAAVRRTWSGSSDR